MLATCLLSVGHVRLSLLAFQVFFCTGCLAAMPWRAQSHRKSQRWPSYIGCKSQIWTNLLSVGRMLYWVLVMCASLSAFQGEFVAISGICRTIQSRDQFRHRSLLWRSCSSCVSPLLFYEVLVQALQHFSLDECWLECLLTHNFKRFVFLFTGTSWATDWLGQSQLKYLPWSSWTLCESSHFFI